MENMEKLKKCAEICLLGLLIVIVWLLFSIPTIVHFSPDEDSSSSNSEDTSLDVEFCVQEVYEGVCKQHLMVYQDCDSNETLASGAVEGGVVYIPSAQANQEDTVRGTLSGVTAFIRPSEECESDLLSYLCLSMLGVCTDAGRVVRPSSGQCERLRMDVCVSEWARAEAIVESLPPETADQLGFLQCATLANTSICDLVTTQANVSSGSNTTNTSMMSRECSPDFYLNTDLDLCLPLCGDWQQYPDVVGVVVQVIILLCASTIVVVTSMAVVLSCIQHKRMLRLPGVFIVHQLITVGVFQMTWIISYADSKSLFCSHQDYGETISDPTAFCYLTGALAYYIPTHLTLMWLCHVVMVLCSIKFPFAVRKLLGNFKHSTYLHIVLFLTCSLPPAILVGCSLAVGEYITQFPPVFCSAEDRDTTYYLQVLPLSIVFSAGISGSVLILWSLVKQGGASRDYLKAEVKILLCLVIFTFIPLLAITNISVVLRTSVEFERELLDYFMCESTGVSPRKTCSRSGFEAEDHTHYIHISYAVAMIVYVFTTLIYVINIAEIKARLSKWAQKKDVSDRNLQRNTVSTFSNTPNSSKFPHSTGCGVE